VLKIAKQYVTILEKRDLIAQNKKINLVTFISTSL